MQSSNNLKQMALAMANLNDTYGVMPCMDGYFPHGQGKNRVGAISGAKGPMTGTPFYWMLPFIEQQNAYNNLLFGPPIAYNDSWHCKFLVKTFISPSDPSAPANGDPDTRNPRFGISYAANEYVLTPIYNGAWPKRDKTGATARMPASIPDGTSNTILFAEKRMMCPVTDGAVFYWGETGGGCSRIGNNPSVIGSIAAFNTLDVPQFNPPVNACIPCMLNSSTTGGILVGLFDGSVHLISQGISGIPYGSTTPTGSNTWTYAVLPNDGFPLGSDW
jgi:hypothetical protein